MCGSPPRTDRSASLYSTVSDAPSIRSGYYYYNDTRPIGAAMYTIFHFFYFHLRFFFSRIAAVQTFRFVQQEGIRVMPGMVDTIDGEIRHHPHSSLYLLYT